MCVPDPGRKTRTPTSSKRGWVGTGSSEWFQVSHSVPHVLPVGVMVHRVFDHLDLQDQVTILNSVGAPGVGPLRRRLVVVDRSVSPSLGTE